MKLLLIRHSLASDIVKTSDFERELTQRGVKRALRFFRVMKEIYPRVDLIITSAALRAKQTAEVMNRFYKTKMIEMNELYQADIEDFKKVLEGKEGVVAIVGHEPDLSTFAGYLTGVKNIKLSKPSLVEIEDDVLKGVFQYKQIKAIYEVCFKSS